MDPYGLDYGFMVFDPGVEKLLGEVEPWEHLPFMFKVRLEMD